jgi:hypothetical protein
VSIEQILLSFELQFWLSLFQLEGHTNHEIQGEEITLKDGKVLPKGTNVAIMLSVLQQHPQFWNNPGALLCSASEFSIDKSICFFQSCSIQIVGTTTSLQVAPYLTEASNIAMFLFSMARDNAWDATSLNLNLLLYSTTYSNIGILN